MILCDVQVLVAGTKMEKNSLTLFSPLELVLNQDVILSGGLERGEAWFRFHCKVNWEVAVQHLQFKFQQHLFSLMKYC